MKRSIRQNVLASSRPTGKGRPECLFKGDSESKEVKSGLSSCERGGEDIPWGDATYREYSDKSMRKALREIDRQRERERERNRKNEKEEKRLIIMHGSTPC